MKVKIIDMTHEGKGVARTEEGLTLFVEGAFIGDTADVEITKKKKRFAEARAKAIVEQSPYRVESRCPVSAECGGCDYQELNYEKQLELKEKRVRDALKKIGKLDVEVEDIIHGETISNYRNKSIFHVKSEGDKAIGFYKKKSHDIVTAESCNISNDASVKLIPVIKEIIDEYGIIAIADIMVRQSKHSGDAMVVLVTDRRRLDEIEEVAERIMASLPEVKTVVQNVKNEKSKGLLGKKSNIIAGDGFIYEQIDGLKFKISPETFFQVNTEGMELLYGKVMDYIDLKKTETVYDVYCGVGSISLLMAKKAKQVYGIEVIEKSIENAKENAVANGISNAEFFAGQAEWTLPELGEKGYSADKVVLDPPRKGCETAVLDAISKMGAKTVVYVSCDPSTMARDVSYLVTEKGYRVDKVQPVDMFPMTGHVESVVLLVRE